MERQAGEEGGGDRQGSKDDAEHWGTGLEQAGSLANDRRRVPFVNGRYTGEWTLPLRWAISGPATR